MRKAHSNVLFDNFFCLKVRREFRFCAESLVQKSHWNTLFPEISPLILQLGGQSPLVSNNSYVSAGINLSEWQLIFFYT